VRRLPWPQQQQRRESLGASGQHAAGASSQVEHPYPCTRVSNSQFIVGCRAAWRRGDQTHGRMQLVASHLLFDLMLQFTKGQDVGT